MKLAIYILCLISTIAIIPLAWCIPMTMKAYRSYKEGKDLSTGFGVCALPFVNLIAGILILACD